MQPPDKPVLRDAIDATLCTIEERARLYRNLVVAVSVLSILSVLSAVLSRQWIAFAGFLLVMPLIGGFLFLDSRRIRRWRSEILEKFLKRGLDVAIFRKTISGFGHLPAGSLQGMLSTIPYDESASLRQTREQNPAGDDFDSRTRKSEGRILRTSGLLTLALGCFTGAAFYRSLILLLCGAGLTILFTFLRRR